MELEEAKTLLNGCVRSELRDHAFGDKEVFWIKDGKEIATGYFGGGQASVAVGILKDEKLEYFPFEAGDARELSWCGTEGEVERNDETGPDEFVEGQIMPGLTKDAVARELGLD